MTHPTDECTDCSYNFESMYNQIDKTRHKLFQAYFIGAIGLRGPCLECDPYEPGMMEADVPMTMECRKCHYPIEDFLNTDHEDCLHGIEMRCMRMDRGLFNYMQDVYNVLKEEALALLTPAAAGYSYGYSYGATYGGEPVVRGGKAKGEGGDEAAAAEGDAAPAEGAEGSRQLQEEYSQISW